MTRPGMSPRPARPATCTSSWNARSLARKSGMLSAASALTTPTSVTLGKSWPLVTICVPTRMSISRARTRARIASTLLLPLALPLAFQGQAAAPVAGGPRRGAPQVAELDARQRLRACPVEQTQLGGAPGPRQVVALERRCGAAEDAHAPRATRAPDRHVARVVAHA